MTSLLAVLVVVADALGEVAARVTYGAIGASVVFVAGQLAGGAPPAETVNTVGWVALALACARLAFTVARTMLADVGGRSGAVTA